MEATSRHACSVLHVALLLASYFDVYDFGPLVQVEVMFTALRLAIT